MKKHKLTLRQKAMLKRTFEMFLYGLTVDGTKRRLFVSALKRVEKKTRKYPAFPLMKQSFFDKVRAWLKGE